MSNQQNNQSRNRLVGDAGKTNGEYYPGFPNEKSEVQIKDLQVPSLNCGKIIATVISIHERGMLQTSSGRNYLVFSIGDGTGEIPVTAWSEIAEPLVEVLKENRSIKITGGKLERKRNQFDEHRFHITLDFRAQVVVCGDDGQVYNVTPRRNPQAVVSKRVQPDLATPPAKKICTDVPKQLQISDLTCEYTSGTLDLQVEVMITMEVVQSMNGTSYLRFLGKDPTGVICCTICEPHSLTVGPKIEVGTIVRLERMRVKKVNQAFPVFCDNPLEICAFRETRITLLKSAGDPPLRQELNEPPSISRTSVNGSERLPGTAVSSGQQRPDSFSEICPERKKEAQGILPKEAQANLPQQAQAILPKEAQAILPEEALAILPEEAQAILPEEAQAILQVDAQAIVPEEAQAILPKEAQALVQAEAQAILPEETPAILPKEAPATATKSRVKYYFWDDGTVKTKPQDANSSRVSQVQAQVNPRVDKPPEDTMEEEEIIPGTPPKKHQVRKIESKPLKKKNISDEYFSDEGIDIGDEVNRAKVSKIPDEIPPDQLVKMKVENEMKDPRTSDVKLKAVVHCIDLEVCYILNEKALRSPGGTSDLIFIGSDGKDHTTVRIPKPDEALFILNVGAHVRLTDWIVMEISPQQSTYCDHNLEIRVRDSSTVKILSNLRTRGHTTTLTSLDQLKVLPPYSFINCEATVIGLQRIEQPQKKDSWALQIEINGDPIILLIPDSKHLNYTMRFGTSISCNELQIRQLKGQFELHFIPMISSLEGSN